MMTPAERVSRVRGFTLIELMIVVVVVAILASIAYPSYMSSTRKARRVDGKNMLTRVQVEQEKWRANNPTYADTLGGTAGVSGLGLTATSPDGFYAIAITASSTTGFTATATPQAGQASDTDCNPLTLSVGASGDTKTPALCW